MAEGGYAVIRGGQGVPAPPVTLTDEQQRALAAALVDASVAILAAIGREASRADFDGPRNVMKLTQSLGPLSALLGAHHPMLYGMPMFDPDEDM